MVSLVIYIISFVIIIGIVGMITTVFNYNIKDINMTSGASSEYNKFNLYMLDQTQGGYSIAKCSNETDTHGYVMFSNGKSSNTFVLLENMLYFNKIKLCENVKEFKVKKEIAENGNDILKTYININDTVYSTDYVIE